MQSKLFPHKDGHASCRPAVVSADGWRSHHFPAVAKGPRRRLGHAARAHLGFLCQQDVRLRALEPAPQRPPRRGVGRLDDEAERPIVVVRVKRRPAEPVVAEVTESRPTRLGISGAILRPRLSPGHAVVGHVRRWPRVLRLPDPTMTEGWLDIEDAVAADVDGPRPQAAAPASASTVNDEAACISNAVAL